MCNALVSGTQQGRSVPRTQGDVVALSGCVGIADKDGSLQWLVPTESPSSQVLLKCPELSGANLLVQRVTSQPHPYREVRGKRAQHKSFINSL